MTKFSSIKFAPDAITMLPSGGLMTVSPNIVFDGKTLNIDDSTLLWENIGTGTFVWANNKVTMSVTSGQYYIRQSRRRMAYASGYPMLIEGTFDNNGLQANVTKRFGYFSSIAIAPYTTVYDGFWLENDGATYRLMAARSGVETVNVPFTSWSGYTRLSAYDFNNFTAIYFDFLWLGGAGLRIWVCTPDKGWVLGHAATYVGNNQDTICSSPNQPIRYEIVSSTGVGSFRPICAQVSIAGPIEMLGQDIVSINTIAIACNAIGIIYALQGFKKNATYRDIALKLQSFGCVNSGINDTGMLMLLRNPTLSAALTYVAYEKFDRAIATNQTITNVGEIICVTEAASGGDKIQPGNYKSWLTQTISNTFDQYILAYMSGTTNQSVYGHTTIKQY